LFDLGKIVLREKTLLKKKGNQLISGEKEHSLVIEADRTKVSLVSLACTFFRRRESKTFCKFCNTKPRDEGKVSIRSNTHTHI
jgi:protein associated with RNAse G/E